MSTGHRNTNPNQSSSLLTYLELESQEETALSGALPLLFRTEDDDDTDDNDQHDDTDNDGTNDQTNTHPLHNNNPSPPPPPLLDDLEECTVDIGNSHSIRIIQSSSAFRASGEDDTGSVLWGASVHLASFLSEQQPQSQPQQQPQPQHGCAVLKNRNVIELGCGCGLVSIAAAKLGADRVIATDFRSEALHRTLRHAKTNGVENTLNVEVLDWDNVGHRQKKGLYHSFDVVLASDVIYGMEGLVSLMRTIDDVLVEQDDGVVIVATRDGRRGVEEFKEAMCTHMGFWIETEKNIVWRDDDLENVPSYFSGEGNIARWKANHSIYIFRRSLS